MKKKYVMALLLLGLALSSGTAPTVSVYAQESANEEVPSIEEDFETSIELALARGEVTLEHSTEGEGGSGALKVSGRTDSWNGVNFDANAFRGNSITTSASVKGASATFHITIQYDIDGNTLYNWITTASGNADSFVTTSGTYTIPENAENIYVYIESDDTQDFLVDSFTLNVSGVYKVPGEIQATVLANTTGYPSLKETLADHYRTGVAVSDSVVASEPYAELICSQFCSITHENNLKPESILDKEATLADTEHDGTRLSLDFSKATAELDFAVQNGLQVRGHTLIWHSQTPDWIFYKEFDSSGELADRDLMLARMENYIRDVFTWAETNYPDTFYAWDIVNEAIDDNGGLRDSLWLQTIGEDYLEQAFAFARKYAPDDISLFYNDYNAYQAAKLADIIEVLTPIAEAGNLDGVGMQGHINTSVSPTVFADAAKKYADSLGVVIHITELDIEEPSSADPAADQGTYFEEFFTALNQADDQGVPVECVTFWGLTDSLSWKAGTNPLLFSGDLNAKPAFYGVINAASDVTEN